MHSMLHFEMKLNFSLHIQNNPKNFVSCELTQGLIKIEIKKEIGHMIDKRYILLYIQKEKDGGSPIILLICDEVDTEMYKSMSRESQGK